MILYNYNPKTGEYINSKPAKLSPLDLEMGYEVYLQPAYSTFEEPPQTGDNEVAVYKNNEWRVMPDYRGTTDYNVDGTSFVIDTIGVEPQINTAPPKELVKPFWDGSQWIDNESEDEKIKKIEEKIIDLRIRVNAAEGLSIQSDLQNQLNELENKLNNIKGS